MLLNSMQRNKIYALVSVETARFLIGACIQFSSTLRSKRLFWRHAGGLQG